MKVADNLVLLGMQAGVEGIRREIEECGTAEDKECLHYCLHERAGSSPKLFANSPYPRDCGEDGLPRPDRLTSVGEGMRLSDFAAHPNVTLASLSEAHVLSLR